MASYTLRGGPDDDELGYWLGEGDLDEDGRADLVVGAFGSPSVYVVLGASLFRRPPGEYPISDVADFTVLTDAGAFGQKSFAVVGGALYISPISPSGRTPTWRIPFTALVAAGAQPRPVEELADASFTGADAYGHVLEPCDVDADGLLDLVMGSYAVPGVQAMTGAVDLDTDGLLLDFDAAVQDWGPCADLDGDGESDDFMATIIETPYPSTDYTIDVWYGPLAENRSGTTLPLAQPDVVFRPGGREPGMGAVMYTSPEMVGDWNGDGHPDLAVHAHGTTEFWTDVLLYQGDSGFRPAGTTLTRADAALIVADEGDVLLGRPLSLGGDLNADGRDDLVLADHLIGPDEVYARYCPPGPGTLTTAGFAQVTWAAADGQDVQFLRTLVAGGDLDGNGTDDVVIGAPESTDRHGAVLVMASASPAL